MSATTLSTPRSIARRRSRSQDVAARRRRIDPTTCERDYGPEEIEFMRALEAYKRSSGRLFPTCSEILEVVHSLGYRRETSASSGGFHAGGSPLPG